MMMLAQPMDGLAGAHPCPSPAVLEPLTPPDKRTPVAFATPSHSGFAGSSGLNAGVFSSDSCASGSVSNSSGSTAFLPISPASPWEDASHSVQASGWHSPAPSAGRQPGVGCASMSSVTLAVPQGVSPSNLTSPIACASSQRASQTSSRSRLGQVASPSAASPPSAAMLHDLHMRVTAQQQLLMLQHQKQQASVYQLLQQVQAVMGPAQISAYHAHASAQQQQHMLQAPCLLQAQQLHMLQQQQQQQQRSPSSVPSARQQLFPAPQAMPLQQPMGWPYPHQHQLQHHHHHSPYHHNHQQQQQLQQHPASPQDASNAFWLNLRPVQTAQADKQSASGGSSAASLAASAAATGAAAAAAGSGSGGWHGMRGMALLGAWAEQHAGRSPRGVARSPHKLPAVAKELEREVDVLVRLVVRVALWEEEAY